MEKIVAIIENEIVQSVLYIGIPNNTKDPDEFVSKTIKTACKNIGKKGDPVFIADGEAVEGDVYKDGKFFKRERKDFNILFSDPEYGPVMRIINHYSDAKGINRKLEESFPGIKEFFIIPDDQVEYIKSLPAEALDLSDPDIVIKGVK